MFVQVVVNIAATRPDAAKPTMAFIFAPSIVNLVPP